MKEGNRSKIIFLIILRNKSYVCTQDSDSLSDFQLQLTGSWWMVPEIEYAVFSIDCLKKYSYVFNTCLEGVMDIEERLEKAMSLGTLEANINIISNMIFDLIIRNNPQARDLIITRLI